jgi:hypothetical protein
MKRIVLTAFVAACLVLPACQKVDLTEGLAPGQGTTRTLGEASYQQAFATSRMTLGQYFPIAEANPNTGIIKTRARAVDAGHDRILGGSPARQVATLKLTRENGLVIAQILVMQQRQGAAPRKAMGFSQERYNYTGNPGDETPADLDAATTGEQNQAWQNEKPRHDIEVQILDDLYKRLHAIRDQ